MLTREQAMAWNPVLELRSLHAPLAAATREVAPVALMEQLRAEGVPVDAVGVWAAAVAAALDGSEHAGKWDELGLHLLHGALTPRARAWAAAFRAHLADRGAAEGLLELLLATNQLWRLSTTFNSCPPASGE
jgi:hypothetical protein